MDPDLATRIAALEQKLDAIYISTEKTRKYFLWTLIGSVALFLLPLIGLLFALPLFFANYLAPLQSLTQ